jgi:hypothetical protein
MTLEETIGRRLQGNIFGVLDKVIQAILRHADVSATQRSYIKTAPKVMADAMKQLEAK